MKSLSEIETTSKRASRALGYSWGISEEVGKSVRLLEMFNFEGIKNLNQYLKSLFLLHYHLSFHHLDSCKLEQLF